jgi:lipid II:glycine glycyltransferase (peptidoglycan interpeptide bridge formation enzyme)
LLRTNYLSEFRTEIEKARARKNLGIPDEMQMKWGGMSGYIEEQRDLIKYMEKKWQYTTELSKDITTVAQALDYIMELITTYTDQNESLNKVQEDIKSLDSDIKKTDADLRDIEKALQDNIDINAGEIGKLQEAIKNINGRID